MIRIGTSGWRYPPWRGVFYPQGLPHRRELEYLSARLNSVELNGSFYSLQRPESYQSWAAQTPDNFAFAIKGSRFITHLKRLRDIETPLANFLASGILALGPKLGPLLWQLPATVPFNPNTLAAFFDRLPRDTATAAQFATAHDERLTGRAYLTPDANRPIRHALEPRHPTFTDPAVPKLLRHHNIALVEADTAGTFPQLDEPTTDFAYLRLHGDTELYTSGYTPEALANWAAKIHTHTTAHRDVYVYFDNDAKVRAPIDALALTDLVTPPTP